MINPLKTSILLLVSLVLFSNQPQFKAELEVSSVSTLQANLVAVEEQVHVWKAGSEAALRSLASSLPSASAPVLPKLSSQRQMP